MVTTIYLFYNFSFSTFVWEQKINIIGSIFLGLAIYSYFYKKKIIKKEIYDLRKQAVKFEMLKDNLIRLAMSENERYTIKEMMIGMSQDFKSFKLEVRDDIKELTKMFSDYMLLNNDRISALEGKQKLTTKTILTYVGFFSIFVAVVVNAYISFKG